MNTRPTDPSSLDPELHDPPRDSEPTQGQVIIEDARVIRLEAQLARSEAQVTALAERVTDLEALEGKRKQRGLYYRIGLLVLCLGTYFYLYSTGS